MPGTASTVELPNAATQVFRGPRGIVPYVSMWSGEALLPAPVLATTRGIRYLDETPADRDVHGMLWTRATTRPGVGQPLYQRLHPLRQRRAMRRLLCQVCARPVGEAEHGCLWLVPDQRDEWADWPERAHSTQPPLCERCARVAVKACPWLASGDYLAVRAQSRVRGARGALHYPGAPQPTDAMTLTYDDPRICWLQADQLTRELRNCRKVTLSTADAEGL